MAKKKEGTITKTKDLTQSGSLTRTGEALPTIEELLGKKDSPLIDDDQFLLKLQSAQRHLKHDTPSSSSHSTEEVQR